MDEHIFQTFVRIWEDEDHFFESFIHEPVDVDVCIPPPDNIYFCGNDVLVCGTQLIADPGPPNSLPDGLLLCGLDIIILPDDCLVLC